MNVKAVHKIKDLLSVEQLERLEQMALQYQRYARIFFKIMALNKEKKELVLFLTQILLYFNVPYQYTILMMFLIAYNIAYIVSDEKKKD